MDSRVISGPSILLSRKIKSSIPTNSFGSDRKEGTKHSKKAPLTDHRRLSLKFLAWYLLDQNVQVSTHDSIEDARTALLLYQKYLELAAEGRLQETLRDIYEKGASLGFKPPQIAETVAPASPPKPEFEGAREIPVLVPGSQTPMRIMMRGENVRSRPISSDGGEGGKRDFGRAKEM